MTNDPQGMKDAIRAVIVGLMDRVMHRVLDEDPFDKNRFRTEKPLYAALVPDTIFKGSHFERRFVTLFGSVWEELAVAAARSGLGYGERGRKIFGMIKSERLTRISRVLNALEHPERGQERKKPDWGSELSYVLAGKGEDIPVQVVCDVYVANPANDQRYAFELKAPLPNSDITKVSKEKILKLYSMDTPQVDGAYFALPYNPYGARENYDWSFPARWFDMRKDPVVLIGDEFWEKIGGLGTYQAFIAAVNEIGREYKDRIYQEYLGMEPPDERFNP